MERGMGGDEGSGTVYIHCGFRGIVARVVVEGMKEGE